MQKWSLVVLILLLSGAVTPAMAADTGRYGYITVEQVDIYLVNDKATVDISYKIDDGIQFIVLLLGKSDLRTKLEYIVDYNGAEFKKIELDHAVLEIENASIDYNDGSYWFPEHEFGITLPRLVITTPQVKKEFTNTSVLPTGVGHFKT
ncbi:MAG: hypothetical protein QCH35_01790 [Methanomicrobiaceae archaeon]|nr:hypothetical protein [Methanomicrobiaceae archaeon]